VVLADVGRGDRILCQVTSNSYGDVRAVRLDDEDFATGSLRVTSHARPGKLFTANRDLMSSVVPDLKAESLTRLVDAVVNLLREGS